MGAHEKAKGFRGCRGLGLTAGDKNEGPALIG